MPIESMPIERKYRPNEGAEWASDQRVRMGDLFIAERFSDILAGWETAPAATLDQMAGKI